MKCIHEELDETNIGVEAKSRNFEDINTKVNEMQIAMSSEDPSDEILHSMRMRRDQVEIEFKVLKDKKDRLENEKKKILKSIKIGNDYLELFNNSVEIFDMANK